MVRAFIEAGPAGSHVMSSWPGKKGNQVAQVAECKDDLEGLQEAFGVLKSNYTRVSDFALAAWLEYRGVTLQMWEIGHMTYEEAMHRMKIGG